MDYSLIVISKNK